MIELTELELLLFDNLNLQIYNTLKNKEYELYVEKPIVSYITKPNSAPTSSSYLSFYINKDKYNEKYIQITYKWWAKLMTERGYSIIVFSDENEEDEFYNKEVIYSLIEDKIHMIIKEILEFP